MRAPPAPGPEVTSVFCRCELVWAGTAFSVQRCNGAPSAPFPAAACRLGGGCLTFARFYHVRYVSGSADKGAATPSAASGAGSHPIGYGSSVVCCLHVRCPDAYVPLFLVLLWLAYSVVRRWTFRARSAFHRDSRRVAGKPPALRAAAYPPCTFSLVSVAYTGILLFDQRV